MTTMITILSITCMHEEGTHQGGELLHHSGKVLRLEPRRALRQQPLVTLLVLVLLLLFS